MTETPEEFRRRIEETDNRFYDQVAKRGDGYRTRSLEYDKIAVDFANKGFQSLTYLNGGALVAIPTAMAFFKADVGKIDILSTAGAFVIGLLFVVFAQIAAFFTVSSRSEQAQLLWSEQWKRVAANQFPHPSDERTAQDTDASKDRINAQKRSRRGNVWRYVGLACFILSLIAFIAGCVLGG